MNLADDQDFINHFGGTLAQIKEHYSEKPLLTYKREAFNALVSDIKNPTQLADYYKSMAFIAKQLHDFKNGVSDYLGEGNPTGCALIPRLFKKKPVKILDHGCGHASFSIYCLLRGHEVTLADIPNKLFYFLKDVLGRKFPNAKFQEITNETDLGPEVYDYIHSCEVLEHVIEPEQVLDALIAKIRTGGYLWLSVFFDDMQGEDPSHLVTNTRRYNRPQTWHRIVCEKGLYPVAFDKGRVLKMWHKSYRTQEELLEFVESEACS